jgi:hypothetical protein
MFEEYKVNIPEGKSGNWEVKKYSVTEEEEKFARLRCAFNPQRECRYVPAGNYTMIVRDGHVIMSDTPDEIRDIIRIIRMAKGNCLIVGLGLGVVARAFLNKPEVSKVTIAELSEDVIILTGNDLKKEYGDRVEIIQADIMKWRAPKNVFYDVVWFDIWDNISCDNIEQMNKLKNRFHSRSGQIGCWQEDGCKTQKKRIKNETEWY